MRIVIDLQGAQSASRLRGIGRYSVSLAQALARKSAEHEIWLALNASFPESAIDIRNSFQDLIPGERIHLFTPDLPTGEQHITHPGLTRAAEKIREYSLAHLKPDVVLVTSLFEGFLDQAVTSIGSFASGIKTAVINHDLIPLLNPGDYLQDEAYRDFYFRKIKWLKAADLILAISESTRKETLGNLGDPNLNIKTISAPVDQRFRPLDLSAEEEAAIREKYGINRKLLICTSGGFDIRKNMGRLIEAYSCLSQSLRSGYQLVITGSPPPETAEELKAEAGKRGLEEDEIIFTGFVGEQDLPALYNLADLSIYPSLAEGLGLPAIESMACGTPVIASKIPSITHTLGYPDAQFDPRSADSITECLDRYLGDEGRRRDLRDHGLRQTGNSSWEKCAQDTLLALEELHHSPVAGQAREPRPRPGKEDLLRSLVKIEGLPANKKSLQKLSRSITGSIPCENHSRKIYVDISTLHFKDIKTGIQRVVRAQLLELLKNPPPGFSVEPVYLGQVERRWVYRHAGDYLGHLFGIGNLCLPNDPVSFQYGDILYIADYAPAPISIGDEQGLYRQLKAKGVSISSVVYDLLPVLRPDVFDAETIQFHEKMMRAIVSFSDQVICISAAVAEELSDWINEEKIETSPGLEITSLHLGADIEASAPSINHDSGNDTPPYSGCSGPILLMVGTVEPRKGYLQTLAAFDLLWKDKKEVNLLIVGRPGWRNLPPERRQSIPLIIKTMEEHRELDKRLFWLNDATDDMLMNAYDNSSCLLSASEGEGFGLPLIEAARHGLPIIARDIPIFREVAGDNALYFSGLEAESLAGAISEWLKLYGEGKHPRSSGLKWLTWKENVEKLKEMLISIR